MKEKTVYLLRWVAWLTPAFVAFVVIVMVAALIIMGIRDITNRGIPVPITGRVDRLWPETYNGTTMDYVRVVTSDGQAKVYLASPIIWGVLDEGSACTFMVKYGSSLDSVECNEAKR